MKAVLLSIRPQWCELIANGKKTIEVRKTRPKLKTPFKCYIYCTSVKPMNLEQYCAIHAKTSGSVDDWSGKVIGEFVCDSMTNMFTGSRFWLDENAVEQTCLTGNQIREYANGNEALYGWHISALQIYDKPNELSEFKQCHKCPYGPIERCNEHEFSCDKTYSLNRPFQSWGYVEELV